MDGIGATIKHRVFCDVQSEKVSIKNVEHFTFHADSILNGIRSLYMPLVLTEPESASKVLKILGTFEVHMIRRTFNSDGVCKLEFYHTAADQLPFHEQWYTKDSNPEVCGHPELPLSFDPDMMFQMSCPVQENLSGWNESCVISGFTKNVFICRHSYFYVETLLTYICSIF